jgi:hypothetical protein
MFIVARPVDAVPSEPGTPFQVRVLTVGREHKCLNDAERRTWRGESVVVITMGETRPELRHRQIITAKVGSGSPGTARFIL